MRSFSYLVHLAENTKTMKAISVKQPWANLIASGKKTIETRVWNTDYRGKLLIVSSQRPKIEPVGCAVAIANLIDCRKMTKADEKAACCAIYDKAHAWVLEGIQKIKTPFPVKGQLKLFDVQVPMKFATSILPKLPVIPWKILYKRVLKEVFGNDYALMRQVTKRGEELDPETSEVFLIFLQERGVEMTDPDLISEAFYKFRSFLIEKMRR